MPKEADFYTPSEAADWLGLAELTVLGLLTSGELEGHQDEQGRWWIPAAAVDEAVRRSRDTDPIADPSTEETVAVRAESSLREDLERVREESQRHQEEAERLRAELEAERSKGFWRRLFGG